MMDLSQIPGLSPEFANMIGQRNQAREARWAQPARSMSSMPFPGISDPENPQLQQMQMQGLQQAANALPRQAQQQFNPTMLVNALRGPQ